MKRQIIIIHGGDTFENYDAYLDFLQHCEIDLSRYTQSEQSWKEWLRERLGSTYEVVLPRMPNKSNAQYSEWKLWFEKLIPLFNEEVVLVGHSLGAAFLVKYLSENKFPKKILGVFLVGAVYDTDTEGYSIASFALPEKLDVQTEHITFYHSKDDNVVAFSALEQFKRALPNARTRVFEDKGHYFGAEFPEIAEDIEQLEK